MSTDGRCNPTTAKEIADDLVNLSDILHEAAACSTDATKRHALSVYAMTIKQHAGILSDHHSRAELAYKTLERLGFHWKEGLGWVPPRVDYREVLAQLQDGSAYKDATVVSDTYLKKKTKPDGFGIKYESRKRKDMRRDEGLMTVIKRLPSDYKDYGGNVDRWEKPDVAYADCSGGCTWFREIDGSPGFGVCTNPQSPRAGLLTFGVQAGYECFEIHED